MLRPIIEKEAIAWAVAHVSPEKIDEINILNASILGMHRSIDQLKQRPDFIAVDGNKFKPYEDIPPTAKVKAEATNMKFQPPSLCRRP